MNYYEVIPASASYKAQTPLTYESVDELVPGQMVTAPLRQSSAAGVVLARVAKPSFNTKAINSVANLPPLPKQLLTLASWLAGYYATGLGPAAQQIINANYLKPGGQLPDIPEALSPGLDLPPLTEEQSAALAQINQPGTYLLHGETGSGKTRVYLELAQKSLASGRSAIILSPEIGLTAQLARNFEAIFGRRVIVIHSNLSPQSRRLAWQSILTSKVPLVIIGPRSALFAPLTDIGLIVIDECHDSSYHQSDAPHYSTSTVAAKLAELHNCPLILGSATPSINDYFLATERQRPILRLTKLAKSSRVNPPTITLVDLKDRSHFTKSQHLSNKLLAATEAALAAGEQVLLFLNRRGTAHVVICSTCGWIASCPHCDLPLTYHADNHNLRCHTCGYRQSPPTTCPVCGASELNFRGAGSKAIETEVKKIFQDARIRRFDADNPKAERLEQFYDSVKSGDIDIIIGTQIITKGLDLPNLSVVGAIIADTSFYLPDFSADERTYQQIRQVIGRIGRGHRTGKAIIQTYSPDNPVIRSALAGDYASFFSRELLERRKFHFPPATHLLKITIWRASASSTERAANKLKQSLAKIPGITIDGPAPSFHEVRAGKYYWQLVLKSASRRKLLESIGHLPAASSYELDPVSLL